mmetsp:Transcript_96598/g.295508  ORF Transcript_96598/g.295508 Transcript_96598/m.295508 type:complete len:105 (-) Transcript_96598:52-366(-)
MAQGGASGPAGRRVIGDDGRIVAAQGGQGSQGGGAAEGTWSGWFCSFLPGPGVGSDAAPPAQSQADPSERCPPCNASGAGGVVGDPQSEQERIRQKRLAKFAKQ